MAVLLGETPAPPHVPQVTIIAQYVVTCVDCGEVYGGPTHHAAIAARRLHLADHLHPRADHAQKAAPHDG